MGTVDEFVASLPGPDRKAMERVVEVVGTARPDAEQSTSYGMPAFRVEGKPLIGFTSNKNHLSLHPFSPAVVDAVAADLDGFSFSKGTIRFTAGRPPPDRVIERIVELRGAEIVGGRTDSRG
jgi:uncharacterized protein YdhG (YjbR/CyaY superfamily)